MSLCGLVLAGGESRRMGRDKAALTVDGRSLLERAVALVDEVCEKTYVSVRHATTEGDRGRYAQIEDRHGGVGPADGIVSALLSHTTTGWLVVACDLPRLSVTTLAALVAARDVHSDATAYSDAAGLPEPLCAIYEPSCRDTMVGFLQRDVRCPRKMLLSMNTHLLAPAADDALANANTPEQWRDILEVAP